MPSTCYTCQSSLEKHMTGAGSGHTWGQDGHCQATIPQKPGVCTLIINRPETCPAPRPCQHCTHHSPIPVPTSHSSVTAAATSPPTQEPGTAASRAHRSRVGTNAPHRPGISSPHTHALLSDQYISPLPKVHLQHSAHILPQEPPYTDAPHFIGQCQVRASISDPNHSFTAIDPNINPSLPPDCPSDAPSPPVRHQLHYVYSSPLFPFTPQYCPKPPRDPDITLQPLTLVSKQPDAPSFMLHPLTLQTHICPHPHRLGGWVTQTPQKHLTCPSDPITLHTPILAPQLSGHRRLYRGCIIWVAAGSSRSILLPVPHCTHTPPAAGPQHTPSPQHITAGITLSSDRSSQPGRTPR